ncbi:MAG TPA: primosomal protein N' [Elusimicrobia bacterium]|nr:primosomal protein N' [Elusimicrobiota bacterium]
MTLGQRIVVPFGKSKKIGYIVSLSEKSEYPKLKKIISPYAPEISLTAELLTLARWISEYYLCSLGETLAMILSPNLKMVKFHEHKLLPWEEVPFSPLPPTKSQQRVINKIKEKIELGEKEVITSKVFLLHGVSASGKTEVYFQVIDFCLKKNKEVIFLVPEIALTPQFVELFQKRFGKIGLWHSRLSKGEKYRYFLAAKNGELKIMLGARSAIFTPFRNLGLIIIDEEQEFTYKQDKKPFYHAREVALKRAELNNAVLILGSATPSLESFYASKKGRFKLLELPERIEERELPKIKIVDMREEIKKGNRSVISLDLQEMLNECLEKKEQAIIFLNRRGYSTFLLCRRCGYIAKCPSCQLSLVYHQWEKVLSCHYCRYKENVPLICPVCKNWRLSFAGTGTEKVENEIRNLFPQARLRRMDLDTTRKKDIYHEIYHTFKEEKIDILIGTQMIAKGFDFPKVSVVGIINADVALHLPDFRAAERTFQLVTQVAGRAGRAEIPGKVILQTYYPEHYALVTASEHNYNKLYSQEIKLRKELGYPPFVHLVRILTRGKKEETVCTLAKKITEKIKLQQKLLEIKNDYLKGIEIIGPTPAAYPRIAGKYRWQILLKLRNETNLRQILNPLKDSYHSRSVQVSFDVEPLDMF